jgi:hypothetical protein
MEPMALVAIVALIGVMIASVIGLFASRRSAGSIRRLEHSLTQTKKRSRENAQLAAKNAGIATRLQSQDWCRKTRPPKLDMKEFQ